MILVTGANGFIGSALVWFLNEKGDDDILITDVITPEERPQLLASLKYKKFMTHTELLTKLPQLAGQISWVYHLGACSDTTELNTDYLREINTEYTQKLFQWCTKNQVGFTYASSGAVYGDGAKGFNDRTSPNEFSPLNPYGDSKLNFDKWVVGQTEVPPHWYGLRFFNVFGPNEYYKNNMASVVFKAFHQINVTGKLKLFRSAHPDYKDGEQLRDFVYVKDICRWMLELTEKKPKNGIYNMGFGKARTWLDLARAVFSSMGRELEIDWMDIPVELRDRYQYFTEANMASWIAEGLSQPQWSLEKGVQDYVQGHLKKANAHLGAK